jgi:hypothetical protein
MKIPSLPLSHPLVSRALVVLTAQLLGVVLLNNNSSAVEIAGAQFLHDNQARAVHEKVNTLFTVYSLTYRQANDPSLVSRKYRVEEWMTGDKYRADVEEEHFDGQTSSLTRHNTLITTEGTNYVFDRRNHVMTTNRGQTLNSAQFSHPLLFKHTMVARVLSSFDANCSLISLQTGNYFTRVGTLLHVTQDDANTFTVMERNNPENVRKYIMRFAADDQHVPESVDIWDVPSSSSSSSTPSSTPEEQAKNNYSRIETFKIVEKSSLTLGDAADLVTLTYPKQIDWLDGAGQLRCILTVELLEVNVPLADDVFKPDELLLIHTSDATPSR